MMRRAGGKYHELCTHVREQAQAEGVVLLVFNGEKGNGFSVQATSEMFVALPEMLAWTANEIKEMTRAEVKESPLAKAKLDVAEVMLLFGKATALLSRNEVCVQLISALRDGSLKTEYLMVVREILDELLASVKGPRGPLQ